MKVFVNVLMLATFALAACGGGEAEVPDASAGADQAGAVASDVDLRTVVMTVPSMSCPLCVRSIRARLEEEGLQDIRIDLETKLVRARFDPERIAAEEVEALVEEQGFPVEERRVLERGNGLEGGGA